MLATQIRQKDGVFYFAAYPPKICSRRSASSAASTARGEQASRAEEVPEGRTRSRDFIAKIETTDKAFQRAAVEGEGRAPSSNFYETAMTQPPIPGTVLLFTAETLRFEPVGRGSRTSATSRSRAAST